MHRLQGGERSLRRTITLLHSDWLLYFNWLNNGAVTHCVNNGVSAKRQYWYLINSSMKNVFLVLCWVGKLRFVTYVIPGILCTRKRVCLWINSYLLSASCNLNYQDVWVLYTALWFKLIQIPCWINQSSTGNRIISVYKCHRCKWILLWFVNFINQNQCRFHQTDSTSFPILTLLSKLRSVLRLL